MTDNTVSVLILGLDKLKLQELENDIPETNFSPSFRKEPRRKEVHYQCVCFCYSGQIHDCFQDRGFSTRSTSIPETEETVVKKGHVSKYKRVLM